MKRPRLDPNVERPRRSFLERLGLVVGGGVLALAGTQRATGTEPDPASSAFTPAFAFEPFIGEVMLFAGNYAPVGWRFCDGQLLNITEYTALFSILGTTYGGDGSTTFALPDLRGRSPVHFGQGPGLSNFTLGQQGGVEDVTLTINQMPSHTHDLAANSSVGSSHTPGGSFPAANAEGIQQYHTASNTTMNSSTIQPRGGSQSHENRSPYVVMNYCIAVEGIYPSRS